VLLCAITANAASANTASTDTASADTASPFYANHFDTQPSAQQLTSLGRALFSDPSLSASGKLSCASCHDPRHAFGPPNALAVQRGGATGASPGLRAVPSLMYAQNTPPFTEHFVDDEGNDSIDQGPAGGRTWDGRAQSAHEQAELPLLSPFEMANADAAAVVSNAEHSPHAAEFRAAFGANVFADPALAFKGLVLALESYQQSAAEFYPYTSKYDAVLRREATLSAEETFGLTIFNDPIKGNCARCHPSAVRQGALPQFTDFGYAALGVPRNPRIPANHVPQYVDLGLCGPLREDLRNHAEYCGLFRTPSLRNVAQRPVFFHNGAIHTLRDAVRFYAERDAYPNHWYPTTRAGTVKKFDDLPMQYQRNVDGQSPFGQAAGDAPALNNAEVNALVAFLKTLSDGYAAAP
jgi:cytochrome c peroxidase